MPLISLSGSTLQQAMICWSSLRNRRLDHIIVTPVLRQLHWLPVRQRVEFKLTMLIFKTLHGLAPQYLADDCQLVTASGRRQLQS